MKHTSIEFTFYTVEGIPLNNATFTIFSVKGGFTSANNAVIVPGTSSYITDELGKCTVPLLPSNSIYYVKVEESSENKVLLYKFVVPTTNQAVLQFQDLITETLDPTDLNDALVAQVLGAKAEAIAAKDAAVAAANGVNAGVVLANQYAVQAGTSRDAALVSKNAALVSETAAKQSETLAKASEVSANTSKVNAATSEANALAYRNTTNTHRIAAEASATLAGTHAAASSASATTAQSHAVAANLSAANAASSNLAVQADRAAVEVMKASVEETNTSSTLIMEEVDDLLQQALAIGSGWSPVIQVVADGATREVLQITNWIGGVGVKPAVGFVGSTGIVATSNLAVNVKGAPGINGSSFTVSQVGLSADRVNFDNEAAGFSYLATDTALLYIRIGASGWSEGVPFGKGDKGDPGERGATGETGATGERGPIGLTGPANNLSIGTVNTAPAGGVAAASITGTTPNQILNLTIPQGLKGDKGETGAPGVDGEGAGDMLSAVYDPTNSGSVLHADAVPWAGIEGKPLLLPASKIYNVAIIDSAGTGNAPVVIGTPIPGHPEGLLWTSGQLVAIAAGEPGKILRVEADGTKSVVAAALTDEQGNTSFDRYVISDWQSTRVYQVRDGAAFGTFRIAYMSADKLWLADRTVAAGIGDLTALTTTNKTSLTLAVNELVAGKQDTLVSGTNLKTVNGNVLLGSGDVNVQWKAIDIPSAADLDTYQSEGAYVAATSVIAASLINSPTAVAFSLRVWKAAGVIQEVTEFQANSTRKTYQRSFALGIWSAWARVYTTIDVPTKTAIGLGNVDNTADIDKPVSTDVQTALDTKQDTVVGKGLSTNDYTNGDKAVVNGVTAGLAAKQNTLVSGTNIKTINGLSLLGSGDVPVGGEDQIFMARDEKPNNTLAQAGSSGSYITRNLNTVVANTIPGATLASDKVTLPAGTYQVYARAPSANYDTNNRIRIYNFTTSTYIVDGSSNVGNGGATLMGIFTLAATNAVELRHRTGITGGMGTPNNYSLPEIYSEISIRKLS